MPPRSPVAGTRSQAGKGESPAADNALLRKLEVQTAQLAATQLAADR